MLTPNQDQALGFRIRDLEQIQNSKKFKKSVGKTLQSK